MDKNSIPAEDGAPGEDKAPRFYLSRVRLDSGGYDQFGAYYGLEAPLYRYESECCTIEGYLRARDREQAKGRVRCRHPGARFFR
jgi:hypothetical protein